MCGAVRNPSAVAPAAGHPRLAHAVVIKLYAALTLPALTAASIFANKTAVRFFCCNAVCTLPRRQEADARTTVGRQPHATEHMPKLKPDIQRARREHILDAAEQCFARAGFHRTTMHDICREAGVSPGALYVYFDSKEALIAGIAERDRAEFAERLAALADAPDFLQALKELGEHYFVRGARRQAAHVHRDRPGVDAQPARRRDLASASTTSSSRASRSCSSG